MALNVHVRSFRDRSAGFLCPNCYRKWKRKEPHTTASLRLRIARLAWRVCFPFFLCLFLQSRPVTPREIRNFRHMEVMALKRNWKPPWVIGKNSWFRHWLHFRTALELSRICEECSLRSCRRKRTRKKLATGRSGRLASSLKSLFAAVLSVFSERPEVLLSHTCHIINCTNHLVRTTFY